VFSVKKEERVTVGSTEASIHSDDSHDDADDGDDDDDDEVSMHDILRSQSYVVTSCHRSIVYINDNISYCHVIDYI